MRSPRSEGGLETIRQTGCAFIRRHPLSRVPVRSATRQFDRATGLRMGAEAYLAQNHTLFEYLLPECPVRAYHVDYVVNVVSTFWVHELSHVLQGHLELLRASHGSEVLRLCEFPEMDVAGSEWMDMVAGTSVDQTLAIELDADIEAILVTIAMIVGGWDDEGESQLDALTKVKLFTFFLCAVFGAISTEESMWMPTHIMSHPPARIRLLNALMLITLDQSWDTRVAGALDETVRLVNRYRRYEEYYFMNSLATLSEADEAHFDRLSKERLSQSMQSFRLGKVSLRALAPVFWESILKGGANQTPAGSIG